MVKNVDALICENLRCRRHLRHRRAISHNKKPQQINLKGLFAFFMDCYLVAILTSLGVKNSKKRSNQPFLDS